MKVIKHFLEEIYSSPWTKTTIMDNFKYNRQFWTIVLHKNSIRLVFLIRYQEKLFNFGKINISWKKQAALFKVDTETNLTGTLFARLFLIGKQELHLPKIPVTMFPQLTPSMHISMKRFIRIILLRASSRCVLMNSRVSFTCWWYWPLQLFSAVI